VEARTREGGGWRDGEAVAASPSSHDQIASGTTSRRDVGRGQGKRGLVGGQRRNKSGEIFTGGEGAE
jgi:hypothetical protein